MRGITMVRSTLPAIACVQAHKEHGAECDQRIVDMAVPVVEIVCIRTKRVLWKIGDRSGQRAARLQEVFKLPP